MAKKLYEALWRNKWLTSEAQSIDDMISAYQKAIKELEEYKADGIVGEFSGAGDDYVVFTTVEKAVAKKYGFE